MYLETGKVAKRNRMLQGNHHFCRKKSKLSQSDNGTEHINLGHFKYEKIAPYISTAFEGINAKPH